MEISEYLKEIQKTYTTNQATEHSYRLALAKYLTALFGKDISVYQLSPKEKTTEQQTLLFHKLVQKFPLATLITEISLPKSAVRYFAKARR